MPLSNLTYLGDRFHLLAGPDDDLCCPDRSTHVRLAPLKPVLLSGIVRSARQDRRMMGRLRLLLARYGSTQRVNQFTDAEVIRRISQYLESGRLGVVQCGGSRSWAGSGGGGGAGTAAGTAAGNSKSSGSGTASDRNDSDYAPPPPPKPKKTWVEVELLDWEGNPAANERYEIRLPDGSLQEGRLDASGRARFTGIDPGTCEVTFPEFDGREWREN
jgi:hypothetical protein